MAVSEVVGVYDAEGSLRGEVAYAWGKVRGTRHCGLCDVTHSWVRRKQEWDAMAAALPLPVRLLHLDELDDHLTTVVAQTGAPVVLGHDGPRWRTLLGAAELDAMDGSVTAFDAALRRALEDDVAD